MIDDVLTPMIEKRSTGRPRSALRLEESLPLIREHITAAKTAGLGLVDLLRDRAVTRLIARTRANERPKALRHVIRAFFPEEVVSAIVRAIDPDRKEKRPKARKPRKKPAMRTPAGRRIPCRYGAGAFVVTPAGRKGK